MRKWQALGLALLASELFLGISAVHAGGKISIDDTKWISLGVGARASFSAVEDSAPSGGAWSKDFNLDSARIYINGQVHKYIKVELNTECTFCGSGIQQFTLLDGIAKFEFTPWLNIWAGRLLVPAERQELNGPYYSTTYDAFKTPFFPADFSTHYGAGGAGIYERDNGFNIWGAAAPEGAFQYVAGIFTGLQSSHDSGPNQNDNLLYAGRIAYNFLSVEKNPGYYTSGTYYGTAGNILTLGVAMQYQEKGSGSFAHSGNFFGFATDLLAEFPLDDVGVLTFNGEYKHFDSSYSKAAFTDGDPNAFLMFDGDSFSLIGLYLIPQTVGIGKFQPYVRYSGIYPDGSSNRDEFEVGLNYIIDGTNARIALFYEYGDLATKGLNYSPTASGDNVSAIKLGLQLQL